MKAVYCLILITWLGLGSFTVTAQPTTPTAPFNWQRFEVEQRPAFVILPEKKNLRPGKLPWILYAPTFDQRLPNAKDEGWMIERFLAEGIAIAGVDVGESYGSPQGRTTYNALYHHVVEKYGFDTKACLLARSRGGLMLYAWAEDHPEKVRCIAGIYPVCDLRSYPGLKKACGAFGMNESELAAALADHNPVDRLAPLAQAGVPIFHIHGDVDKVVPIDQNSGAVAKRYQKLGGSMELLVAPGQWHNMWRGFFECQALVDFVVAHAHGQPNPREPIVELLWDKGAFTEGPAFSPDRSLLFSDVQANAILRFSPEDGTISTYRANSGRANGLMFDRIGRLLACEGATPGGGRRISVTEKDGTIRTLADRWQGKRFNSPNDLVLDAHGNVYFTDPRYVGDEPREIDFEGVFMVSPEGVVKLATREVTKPNGIVISADGKTMLIADNDGRAGGVRQLLSFSVQADGTLTHKKVLHDFGKSRGIDGMAWDATSGHLYATAGSQDESGIYVLDGAGRLLKVIKLPGAPTNCALDPGSDGKTLYVTAMVPPPDSGNEQAGFGLYRIQLAH